MLLRFLGTGTSYGVPFVGCDCAVCTSYDPHDNRLRASIAVEEGETRVLVDTGPDLRQQVLRAGISRVDAVFWTHSHNDHIIGLDDLRPLSDGHGYIPGYADAATLAKLTRVFDYAFVAGREGGFPRVTGQVLEPWQSVQVGSLTVTSLPIKHGNLDIFAYEFTSNGKRLIYATDCSFIPLDTQERMRGADVLILDALRPQPHHGHFHLQAALDAVAKLKPKRSFFTHLSHDMTHEIRSDLPPGVAIAYDTQDVPV